MSVWEGPVRDAPADVPVLRSATVFEGGIWDVRTDRIAFAGQTVDRDVMVHPGAVGVVALDESDQILLVRQYRHPVGQFLFEPPAGLLDHLDEDPLAAAKRELLEEAGFEAERWAVLVDFLNTPGGSSETFRCFLARGLRPAPQGRRHTGEAEEVDLPVAWVDLDRARDLVLGGDMQNPTTVVGVLAAWSSRQTGWSTLRPADCAWPVRDRMVATDRVRRPRGS